MKSKQAEAALIRMVEEGFAEISDLRADRFKVIVTRVQSPHSPPDHVMASATLFFLKGGEPFCCGEPGCHSEIFTSNESRLGDYLRARMHLEHHVTVMVKVSTVYYEGIQFTAFGEPSH